MSIAPFFLQLYTEVLEMGTDVVDKTEKREVPATQLQITFMKAELVPPFSIFRYSVTASTAPGEGVTATTTDVCETPQGGLVLDNLKCTTHLKI